MLARDDYQSSEWRARHGGESPMYLASSPDAHPFAEIIGHSDALQTVLTQLELVAPTDATVLLQGETGTGKELLARAVHTLSARRAHPCVTLNCASIPLGLLESELFGHEKGAFTGALTQRLGRFELAHQGTLFLDEIGDLPLELHPKLLRVLQEHAFERLGSSRTLRTNVRVVAATHRDLRAMVHQHMFREDLYYRLHIFPLTVPPLRARRDDIPLLVQHFAHTYAHRMHKCIEDIPAEAMAALVHYDWPGLAGQCPGVAKRH
jgi:formate hydrogenlyase transcriptional activator